MMSKAREERERDWKTTLINQQASKLQQKQLKIKNENLISKQRTSKTNNSQRNKSKILQPPRTGGEF